MNVNKTMENANIFATTLMVVIFAIADQDLRWPFTNPRFAPMLMNATVTMEGAHTNVITRKAVLTVFVLKDKS